MLVPGWRSQAPCFHGIYLVLALILTASFTRTFAGAVGIGQIDEPTQTSAGTSVEVDNMTTCLAVIVVKAQPATVSDTSVIDVKVAVRNDSLSSVLAFALLLPGEDQGRRISLVDYFLSTDHPKGLQPEETAYTQVTIPATLPLVIKVAGVLLADGESDGDEGSIRELRTRREAEVFQAERAITMLGRWLSYPDLNLKVTDNLLMMKNEIDQLQEENDTRQGPMYDLGLQVVKTYLQDWIEYTARSVVEGQTPPDLGSIVRTRLAALQRAIAAH